MKEYPVFTEDNFEEMCRRYVRISKGRGHVLKVRKPRSGAEFAELTKACLGVELHLVKASASYYEIKEAYDEYKNFPLVKLWALKYDRLSSYYGAKIALQTTFGKLSTGGTARSQYGSFKVISFRDKLRLSNFVK